MYKHQLNETTGTLTNISKITVFFLSKMVLFCCLIYENVTDIHFHTKLLMRKVQLTVPG